MGKILIIISLLIAGLCLAQSPPIIELLYPPSIDSLAINSTKFIDSVYINVVDISGFPPTIESCYCTYDTCFFIDTASVVTDCRAPYLLKIQSQNDFVLPCRMYPIDETRECWCEADSYKCPFVAGWDSYTPAVFSPYAPDSIWFYIGYPHHLGAWLAPDHDPECFTLTPELDSLSGTGVYWVSICGTTQIMLSETTLVSNNICMLTLPRIVEEFDKHPEELSVAPICDTLGNCSDWAIWYLTWFPNATHPMGYTFDWLDIHDPWYPKYYLPKLQVIADYPCPTDTILSTDSLYINICSGGCRDSTDSFADYRFHFRTDSTSAWMTIEWASGADTIHYGDAGTFWFQPDDLPLPWRRFGVLTDNTDLPSSYIGDVTVCLQDVTNAPVVRYGDPVHLHPRGVDPFMPLTVGTTTYDRCVPSPPEPVCWSFTIGGGAIPETEEPRAETGELSLIVTGDATSGLSIEYSCPGEGVIAVYDILGRAIFRRNVSGSGIIDWGEKDSPTGIYFVRATVEDKSVTQRVLYLK